MTVLRRLSGWVREHARTLGVAVLVGLAAAVVLDSLLAGVVVGLLTTAVLLREPLADLVARLRQRFRKWWLLRG